MFLIGYYKSKQKHLLSSIEVDHSEKTGLLSGCRIKVASPTPSSFFFSQEICKYYEVNRTTPAISWNFTNKYLRTKTPSMK